MHESRSLAICGQQIRQIVLNQTAYGDNIQTFLCRIPQPLLRHDDGGDDDGGDVRARPHPHRRRHGDGGDAHVRARPHPRRHHGDDDVHVPPPRPQFLIPHS